MIVFRGKFRDFTLKALEQGKLQLPPSTTPITGLVNSIDLAGSLGTSKSLIATSMGRALRGIWRAICVVVRLETIDCLSCREGKVRFRYRVPAQMQATARGKASCPWMFANFCIDCWSMYHHVDCRRFVAMDCMLATNTAIWPKRFTAGAVAYRS